LAKEANSNILTKLRPYVLVLFGYAAFLLILALIIDSFVMPSIVHTKEKVKVPNVVGASNDEAKNRLHDVGLTMQITGELYSEKFESGYIMSQNPSPNADIKSGRPIFVSVSKGKETVAVPYLIGSNLRNARLQLMQRGLELGEILYDYTDDFPKDAIFAQSVAAGVYLPYGSIINLKVSKGSESQNRIPILIGFSFDEIARVLAEAGFILGEVTFRHSETYLPNTVIEQNPSFDLIAPAGTAINVVVSK